MKYNDIFIIGGFYFMLFVFFFFLHASPSNIKVIIINEVNLTLDLRGVLVIVKCSEVSK